MNIIKKIIFTTILTIWIAIWFQSIWSAQNFYYNYDEASSVWNETDIWKIIKTDTINQNDSALNKLLKLFKLSETDRYNSGTSKAIYYAKMIINLLLSLVSLIALIMLIYAFYLMFFSKQESGMTKAKQILKWVAIAITIMWLSRFIVSFIFWIQAGFPST